MSRERGARMSREALYAKMKQKEEIFLFIAESVWRRRRKLAYRSIYWVEDARKEVVNEITNVISSDAALPPPSRNNRQVKGLAAHLSDIAKFHTTPDPLERVKIEERILERSEFINTNLLAQTNSVFWAVANKLAPHKSYWE